MEYTVDYFIKKFQAIPEELWCIEERNNRLGQRCAHGHCSDAGGYGLTEEELGLKAIAIANPDIMDGAEGFAYINNGIHPRYQQRTPKQRTLAALYDIKKAQQPEVKIVYVTVDQPVRELQKKELSLQ